MCGGFGGGEAEGGGVEEVEVGPGSEVCEGVSVGESDGEDDPEESFDATALVRIVSAVAMEDREDTVAGTDPSSAFPVMDARVGTLDPVFPPAVP